MDLSSLLTSNDSPAPIRAVQSLYSIPTVGTHSNGIISTPKSLSPNTDSKAVSFRLHDSHSEPKTFYIRPHDTTDSIMDTVKHLFGLSRQYNLGISLEDSEGLSFIPSYENFTDGMTVFVRIEESLPHEFAQRHSYNLRQSQGALNGGSRSSTYPDSRSISPHGRGMRGGSATGYQTNPFRSRQLKRSAVYHDPENDDIELFHHEGVWYSLPHQPFLPGEDEDARTKAASVASADISVENIVEGTRRKRPKFSSNELPLFPPPALPKQSGSVSSLSPSRPSTQVATPYSHRNFSFSHPTPPSNAGDYVGNITNGMPTQPGVSAVVPTPAPTVTSCISDEDVAIQLMRLGNATTEANPVSIIHDDRSDKSGFISDCGEYGEDGRSDTTELPDPLPASLSNRVLPDSPILYPRNQKFKSLDEILPSFDTTEPSEDEVQPSERPLQPPSRFSMMATGRPLRSGSYEDDGDVLRDDDRDETYVAKEEDDDADYEDDLDDVPLKMRRERRLSAAPTIISKPQQLAKGMAKTVKRHPAQLPSKLKPPVNTHSGPHFPISPASPPASRKQSVTSSTGNKPRSHNFTAHTPGTPLSQDKVQFIVVANDEFQEEQRPRCQRCRKSKKGCDRQRPCQRCKDAGVPADQCISEDEAGTRRGRQAAAAAKKAGLADGHHPKNKKKKV